MSTCQDLDTQAVPIVVLVEDEPLHTDRHPFCFVDPICGCHEDPLLIAEVSVAVDAGLLTPAEATDFVAGKTLAWEDNERISQ